MSKLEKKLEILEGVKNCYKNMLQEAKPENKSTVRKWIYELNTKIVALQAIAKMGRDSTVVKL